MIERLYRAAAAALAKEAVRTKLNAQGILVAVKSPGEVKASLPAEVEKWATVIRVANVTVD